MVESSVMASAPAVLAVDDNAADSVLMSVELNDRFNVVLLRSVLSCSRHKMVFALMRFAGVDKLHISAVINKDINFLNCFIKITPSNGMKSDVIT